MESDNSVAEIVNYLKQQFLQGETGYFKINHLARTLKLRSSPYTEKVNFEDIPHPPT